MEKNRGKFIVIEGLDGSGKTSLSKMLAEKLGAVYTFQPSGGPIGLLARDVLAKRVTVCTRALAAIFAADRAEHTENTVKPALESGRHVICDRYYMSNMVYQGGEMPPDTIFMINKLLIPEELFVPDLTVFIDALPKDCIERINADKSRGSRNLYEETDELTEIRERYLQAITSAPGRVAVIDGSGSLCDVMKRIEGMLGDEGFVF
jgi:dTMP kinase